MAGRVGVHTGAKAGKTSTKAKQQAKHGAKGAPFGKLGVKAKMAALRAKKGTKKGK